MSRRAVVLLACLPLVVLSSTDANGKGSDRGVVISGTGAAHGFGMAMDGVEGQARAGWTYDRILSLFYPGSSPGHASGNIRVGLALGAEQRFTLPSGGTVSDAGGGGAAGPGFPLTLTPGATVTALETGGRVVVRADGISSPAAPEKPADQTDDPDPNPLPTPPPLVTPTPEPRPKRPQPTPKPGERTPTATQSSLWITPDGDPALVAVAATGRRYRGSIEVRPDGAGALRVVNHVDLENYVAGIAEEKGQGWPIEGLKSLAVAARSLAVATRTWYAKNQANGYDICPTADCQVYLGYDGEEPAMRQATTGTAGQIRTYGGSAILAMYHGNGGGQTESYHRVAGTTTDPHPYLDSVRYPFADPSRWKLEMTTTGLAETLTAGAVPVPGKLERIDILERGVSPRVLRLRLVGADGEHEVRGTTFAEALGLRSTWFDITIGGEPVPEGAEAEALAIDAFHPAPVPGSRPEPGGPLPAVALASLCIALFAATWWTGIPPAEWALGRWRLLRARPGG